MQACVPFKHCPGDGPPQEMMDHHSNDHRVKSSRITTLENSTGAQWDRAGDDGGGDDFEDGGTLG